MPTASVRIAIIENAGVFSNERKPALKFAMGLSRLVQAACQPGIDRARPEISADHSMQTRSRNCGVAESRPKVARSRRGGFGCYGRRRTRIEEPAPALLSHATMKPAGRAATDGEPPKASPEMRSAAVH